MTLLLAFFAVTMSGRVPPEPGVNGPPAIASATVRTTPFSTRLTGTIDCSLTGGSVGTAIVVRPSSDPPPPGLSYARTASAEAPGNTDTTISQVTPPVAGVHPAIRASRRATVVATPDGEYSTSNASDCVDGDMKRTPRACEAPDRAGIETEKRALNAGCCAAGARGALEAPPPPPQAASSETAATAQKVRSSDGTGIPTAFARAHGETTRDMDDAATSKLALDEMRSLYRLGISFRRF